MDDVLGWFKRHPHTDVLLISNVYTLGRYTMCGGTLTIIRPGHELRGVGFDEIIVQAPVTQEQWDTLYRTRFKNTEKWALRVHP